MKIIEYTLGLPPYRRGGLPRYSTDLSLELSKEDEVFLMYPGSINPFSYKVKVMLKKKNYPFKVIELRNALPVSLGLGIDNNNIDKFTAKRNIVEVKKIIDDIGPNVVHFHTLMGIPMEVLEYLHRQKIKTIFTTHDFYGLCPKMLSIEPIKALTNSNCTDDCMLCKNGPSYAKLIIMQSHIYERLKENKLVKIVRKNKKKQLTSKKVSNSSTEKVLQKLELRRYYLKMYSLIDEFHFNSSVAQKYFMRFLPEVNGKVVPITHSNLNDNRNRKYLKHNNLVIGYVGPYDHKKGFFRMSRIANKITNVTIKFYGDIVNDSIFNRKNVKNYGVVSQNTLTQAYKDMDVLVVPSLWHETFGFVVLEALLQGTPCLVSDTVGSKDLLPKEWVFKNDKELISKLEILKKSKVLKEEREKVRKLKLDYEIDQHAQNIKRIFYEN